MNNKKVLQQAIRVLNPQYEILYIILHHNRAVFSSVSGKFEN